MSVMQASMTFLVHCRRLSSELATPQWATEHMTSQVRQPEHRAGLCTTWPMAGLICAIASAASAAWVTSPSAARASRAKAPTAAALPAASAPPAMKFLLDSAAWAPLLVAVFINLLLPYDRPDTNPLVLRALD